MMLFTLETIILFIRVQIKHFEIALFNGDAYVFNIALNKMINPIFEEMSA